MVFLPIRAIGITVGLVTLCNLTNSSSICVFGPNNTDMLIYRNKALINFMNATLLNLTYNASVTIPEYPNFQLWDFVKTHLPITPQKYLEFVSMGRLRNVTLWEEKLAKVVNHNGNGGKRLSEPIIREFVNPAYEKLQVISTRYRFSLGVFRPRETLFNFTGVLPGQPNSTKAPALPTDCVAGFTFMWQFETPLYFNLTIELNNTHQSTEFAKIANVTDQAFEQYYRTHPNLSYTFVRANVRDIVFRSALLNRSTKIVLEVYFFNNSYTIPEIVNMTSFSDIPPMHYQHDNGSALLISIENPLLVDGSTFFLGQKSYYTSTTQTGMPLTVTSSTTRLNKTSLSSSKTMTPTTPTTTMATTKMNNMTRSTNSKPTSSVTITTLTSLTSLKNNTLFSATVPTISPKISTVPTVNASGALTPTFKTAPQIPTALGVSQTTQTSSSAGLKGNASVSATVSTITVNTSEALPLTFKPTSQTTTALEVNQTTQIISQLPFHTTATQKYDSTSVKTSTFSTQKSEIATNMSKAQPTTIPTTSFSSATSHQTFPTPIGMNFTHTDETTANYNSINYSSTLPPSKNETKSTGSASSTAGYHPTINITSPKGKIASSPGTGSISTYNPSSASLDIRNASTGSTNKATEIKVTETINITSLKGKTASSAGRGSISPYNPSSAPLDIKNASTGFTNKATESTNGSTTFDPDPFFKAEVPVVTKVYNDKHLLWKMGTMAPLVEHSAFYTITIPTSIVIITVVMACMFCLQIDFFTAKKNKDKLITPLS